MTTHPERPSLRVAEIAVTGFRTFRERTIIPLASAVGDGGLAVFHGDNGSGKSNALAALEHFFRGVDYWTQYRVDSDPRVPALRTMWEKLEAGRFRPTRRDLPPDHGGAVVVEVRFVDSERLGTLRLQMEQVPPSCYVTVGRSGQPGRSLAEMEPGSYAPLSPEDSKVLRTLLFGAAPGGANPFFLLDAHRRGPWTREEDGPDSPATLSPGLAERLLSLRQSLDTADRRLWASFVTLLQEFPTLDGAQVSVDRVQSRSPVPELTFDLHGEQVLLLDELSSGEQQVAAVYAALVTSRARVIAIAEPELSLSAGSQRLMRDVLERYLREGAIDQVVLESHSTVFDGPQVVRFKRGERGVSQVSCESASPEDAGRVRAARQAGAKGEWVTAEGYTQLPQEMLRELKIEGGATLWFLKDKNGNWRAWTVQQLDELLGFPGAPASEG